eukprot:scaffold89529_cov56-Attheya_sp.AAC.4
MGSIRAEKYLRTIPSNRSMGQQSVGSSSSSLLCKFPKVEVKVGEASRQNATRVSWYAKVTRVDGFTLSGRDVGCTHTPACESVCCDCKWASRLNSRCRFRRALRFRLLSRLVDTSVKHSNKLTTPHVASLKRIGSPPLQICTES